MISEISPFKDFVCIKVCHNRRVRCFGIVLVCPCLYTNRTSKELQTLLSLFFFSKFELPNRGCGLSTGAAYTRNFTVCCISQKRSGIRGCRDFNLGEPERIYNICLDFHLRLKMLIMLYIPETLRHTRMPGLQPALSPGC